MLKHFMPAKSSAVPASIVDGKLILSFTAAKNPIIWQMDLVNIKISALEIQTQDEETTLVLRNPKGDTITIAVFHARQDALDSLVEISNALAKAHGQIGGAPKGENGEAAPSPYTGKKKSLFKNLLTLIGFITVAIIGISFALNLLSGLNTRGDQSASPTSLSQSSAQDGTPVSADDFLKGQ